MPSYIELDQNITFPSASAAGKLIFGLDAASRVVLVDTNGVTSSFATASMSTPSASYASFAASASYALSASFASTASLALQATSASFASTASFATKANNSYIILQFSHGSTSPGDAVTYYIGNVPDLVASTSDVAGRRLVSPVDGIVESLTVISNVGGTLGTTESSSFSIANITTGVSTTAGTTFQHDASSRLVTYTGFTPLPVTASNEIQVRWTSPTWATNPTTVRQNFIVEIKVS
jgi:hypothetical protein